MIHFLMTLLHVYLLVTSALVASQTGLLLTDRSWTEDLESVLERVVFLFTTYVLVLLWPYFLAVSLFQFCDN